MKHAPLARRSSMRQKPWSHTLWCSSFSAYSDCSGRTGRISQWRVFCSARRPPFTTGPGQGRPPPRTAALGPRPALAPSQRDPTDPHGPWDHLLAFISDGGSLAPEQIALLRLLDGELEGFAFFSAAEVAARLRPRARGRIRSALNASETGMTPYLQDGKLWLPTANNLSSRRQRRTKDRLMTRDAQTSR